MILKQYQYSLNGNQPNFQPKKMVIMLHGYGSNAKNLLELAQFLALPEIIFISVNATSAWEGGFFDSYQWFSLYQNNGQRKQLEEIATEIKESNSQLANFIATQLDKWQLDYKDLALLGFSQGAMMANYQGFTLPKKVAGIISYSGKIILPTLLQQKILHKPKTCLIHGKQDSVLPFENFLEAKQILTQLDASYQDFAFDHLDHSIDKQGIVIGKKFLQDIFI
jgi:phospholipase/carboxylesterase